MQKILILFLSLLIFNSLIADEKYFDLSLQKNKLNSDWVLSKDYKKISRIFKTNNHYELMSFINMIAWISNTEDHHPEITFSYNTAKVEYFTYAINGLSENDFICASKIDYYFKN